MTALLAETSDADFDYDLIYSDEELADALMARAVLACRATLPAIAAATQHAQTHPDEQIRTTAGATAEASCNEWLRLGGGP
ncbi:hypothetical protein [Streptomyces griseorubiginosus]|uniref:hypothetical protein n=1 Tax=Streptomyces griseorubiginosus TaxID=67304 RepID=UPI0036E47E98